MRISKAIMTVGGFTALSRVFGLVREMMISHYMGASAVTDAVFIAIKFPNFFRRIFAEGAFNASFVPMFSHKLVSEGKESAQIFAERVFVALAFVLIIFVSLVTLFTPTIVHVVAPGFVATPEKFDLTVSFMRITFPYILFISLTAHLSGVLNSLDKFAVAAGIPIILNVMMILALWFGPGFGLSYGTSLSISVFLAGITQLLWVYRAVYRQGFHLKLRMPKLTPEVKQLCKLMGPGVIGAGVMNINIFMDTILASYLPGKSISYLFYADRLNQFPLSILGIAAGTALLPSLSRHVKAGNVEEAFSIKRSAVTYAIQLTLPAAVGLMILSYPIIHVIYGLTEVDTQATAAALSAFSIGIPAYVLTKIFGAGFFARQDTKTPVRIACACILVNLILNLILMQYLAHVGLALSTSIAAWVNAGLLYYALKKRDWYHFTASVITVSVKTCCIVALMAAALIVYFLNFGGMIEYGIGLQLLFLGGGVGLGIVLFCLLSIVFGTISLARLKKLFKKYT